MNPRTPEGQCLSRASHSAALAPLLGAFSVARYHRRRNGGRADECTRLESGRPSRVRGFESPPFRHYIERLESVLRTRSPCKLAISGLNVEGCCLGEPTSLVVKVVKRPCLASGRAFCFPGVFGRQRDQYKLPASFRIWLKPGRPRPASQRLNRADRLRNKEQPKAYRSTHATNLLTWLEITSKSALRGLSYAGDKSTLCCCACRSIRFNPTNNFMAGVASWVRAEWRANR